MRNELDKWKNSKKYAIFQAELLKRKQDLINLKVELLENMNENVLTKIELMQLIAVIKDCNEINSEESEELFDLDSFIALGDPEDILIEYIQRQVVWFSYLVIYLSREDYEMCSDIRDVIRIYEAQLIRLIKKTRNDILLNDENYIERITEINEKLFKRANNG